MRMIYLIRHGEPDFPDGKKICIGQIDLPLSNKGINQGERLGKWFSGVSPCALYSSPMLRCYQTAAFLGNAKIVNGLEEQSMGIWEGMSFERIRQEYPDLYKIRGESPSLTDIPEGESNLDFSNRVYAAFENLLNNTEDDFALVTHSGVIHILLSKLLGLSGECLFRLRLEYGSICAIQQNNDGYYIRDVGLSPSSDDSVHETEIASALWQWKPDMIRFMNDASSFGTYDYELAEHILPYLDITDSICDIGCGLAFLDMELSPAVSQVTAVDINLNALSALQKNCDNEGITNIVPLATNASALPVDAQYDAMIFCFFGQLNEILSIAAAHCKKWVFIIQRNYSSHRFSLGKHPLPGDCFAGFCESLTQREIAFEAVTLSPEHGQPFRSLDDARLFFSLYSKDDNSEKLTDTFLSQRLQSTNREDFPYYLPQTRDVGIIYLKADDLRK